MHLDVSDNAIRHINSSLAYCKLFVCSCSTTRPRDKMHVQAAHPPYMLLWMEYKPSLYVVAHLRQIGMLGLKINQGFYVGQGI